MNRKCLFGEELELNDSILLTVKTKCPGKWILIDTETNEVYKGTPNSFGTQWLKLTKKTGAALVKQYTGK